MDYIKLSKHNITWSDNNNSSMSKLLQTGEGLKILIFKKVYLT